MKIFPLKHAQAVEVAKTLQELSGQGSFTSRMAVDSRTNSIIAVGQPDDLGIVFALIQVLDVPKEPRSRDSKSPPHGGGGSPPPAAPPKDSAGVPTAATELEGLWEFIYTPEDLDGVPADRRLRVVFKGDRYATFQGQRLITQRQFKLDPTRTPKRIWLEGDPLFSERRLTPDPTEDSKRVVLEGSPPERGIYEIKDDTLRLSIAPVDAAFPTKFGTEKPEFKRTSRDVPPELLDAMGKSSSLRESHRLRSELLKAYPQLNGLSVGMTNDQFQAIVEKQGLPARQVHSDTGQMAYGIRLDDKDAALILFLDGVCTDIQRTRNTTLRPVPSQ